MSQQNAQQNTGAAAQNSQDPVMQQLEDMSGDEKPSKMGKQGYNGGDPNKSPMFAYQQIHTPQRIVAELAMAKVDRAVYSERQLEEQLADFWFNHFNVYANKGRDPWLLTTYERDAIRPNALGKFQDLVMATAKSPAMLFYLETGKAPIPQLRNAKPLNAECAAGRTRWAHSECRHGQVQAAGKRPAEKETRIWYQRKLRPRINGAAHAWRRWRLHPAGRDRSRKMFHRMDHSPARTRSRI